MSSAYQSQSQSQSQYALSNRESDELNKKVKAEALVKCDAVVREFADCASGRTVSVAWACRDLHKQMQNCLRPHTGGEALERARMQYLAEKRAPR
ncbi:unnamed protein product [Tilletia controversa]|uniref:COX assembly mitochondrial protein n=3 Tax=Tilletia TaxID=13289 RepID=A0A8X7T1B0_9BASI|nr:hypothetical protein CF336_g1519 [Tilletia laevis]KAE8200178.1 hypothetical protein CF328_g3034 [Tilletia controversa]KAE8262177.1 hypothetical protein A4X03_0g2664 [Tilletia caries]KAE8204989.1 hypothetical protein CF335_g2464 [Tilletia laevis]KAE8255730.1 hypothetical protein A4X06_0g270 [Tilletia controversa]